MDDRQFETDLAALLSDSLTPSGIEHWLRAPNRLLDSRRPIDLIAAGELDQVRQAAEAFVEGSYT